MESSPGGLKILLRNTLVKWVTYNDVQAGHWGYLKQSKCVSTGPDKTDDEINYWCRQEYINLADGFKVWSEAFTGIQKTPGIGEVPSSCGCYFRDEDINEL